MENKELVHRVKHFHSGGHIDEVIEWLSELKTRMISEPGFDQEAVYVDFNDDSCSVNWWSLESAEELKSRLKREADSKDVRYKEYRKLKFEFEGEDWSGAQGNLSGFNWKMGDGKDL